MWAVADSGEGAARAGPTVGEDADAALAELERESDGKAKLERVARLAEAAQPKGSTLDSAGVHTSVGTNGIPPRCF